MPETDPLLPNTTPTTQSEPEAKIFFTADELLHHVRRKYQATADTPHTRQRYRRLQATSPGLFLPHHTYTKLTGQKHSVDIVKTVKYGQAGKTQTFNRNITLPRALSHDGCHGNSSGETDRKVLKLHDTSRSGKLQHNMTGGNNKYGALTLSSKEKSTPQEKRGGDTHDKKRRKYGENTASKRVCFFKVSGLHSPRIQCCCCAVGVFAAMFGIFMLSAGICIVLNVTFMEVDTSGLPPDLHNENGKKVVGIILICVALAFLGLSASVSIIYFTLCTRKSQDTTQQQRPAAAGTSTGHERVRNREPVVPGKKRATSSNLNVIAVHRTGMHLHSEFSKKKSYHVLRNRPALPPHQEEESDVAKSSTELSRNDETFSTSHGKKSKQRARREESAESLDVHVISYSSMRTPVIVVNSFRESEQLGTDDMETQLNDSVSRSEDDSVSNIYSERCEKTDFGGPVLHSDDLSLGVTNNSSVDPDGLATLRYNDLSKSDLKSHPEFLHNISIQTEPSSSSCTLVSSSPCPSLPELQQHVLVVKPAEGSSPAVETQAHGTTDIVFPEDSDSLSRLSAVSDRQDNHTVLHDDSKDGFSGLHVNSAFSFDGCDPPQKLVD